MRKVTEQSMEQMRTAIQLPAVLSARCSRQRHGRLGTQQQILGYAERNVADAFEFAQMLVQVRDVQGLAKLQMEFMQAQMQAMTEQAKDLSETAIKAVMDSAKTPTKNGLSS
jgi:hypothetical protein